jgi:ribosomal protein S27E
VVTHNLPALTVDRITSTPRFADEIVVTWTPTRGGGGEMVPVDCPHCGHRITLTEKPAGERVECTQCVGTWFVPLLSPNGDDPNLVAHRRPSIGRTSWVILICVIILGLVCLAF